MKTQRNTRNKALILTASLLAAMLINTTANAKELKLVSEQMKKSKVEKEPRKNIKKYAGTIIPLVFVSEGVTTLNRSDEIEAKVENGQISRREAGKKHAESLGATAGSVSGTISGVLGGVKVGGSIGTFICPGIGTAIGGGAGGIAGGVCGGIAGDAAGKWIGEKVAEGNKNIRNAANSTGQKINKACDSVKENAKAVGNQIKRSSKAATREIQKRWNSVKNCFTSPILVTPMPPILIDDSIRSDDTDGLIGLTESARKWIGEKAAESSKKIRNATTSTGRKINNAYDSVTETATAAGNQIKRSSRAASREIQKGWNSVKNCFSW